MQYFLAIQHTNVGIELGLFNEKNLIQALNEDKKLASKNCVVLARELLQANALSFEKLSFFAANQGPGPFTTLRVVIASINGLGFASKKPLVGIDGLDALLDEQADSTFPITIALLNAYSKDVYFGIDQQENALRNKGYKNITQLLNDLKNQFQMQPLRFIGQATDMYKEQIHQILGNQAVIPTQLPEQCSLKQIGLMAWEAWTKKKNLTNQLLPLYLKGIIFKQKDHSQYQIKQCIDA